MSTAKALLDDLRHAGADRQIRAGKLQVWAPRGVLMPAHREAITTRRHDLMRLLLDEDQGRGSDRAGEVRRPPDVTRDPELAAIMAATVPARYAAPAGCVRPRACPVRGSCPQARCGRALTDAEIAAAPQFGRRRGRRV
jgi:hypothetical protein